MTSGYAGDFATAEQAQAMVKKAVAHIKADGPAKAYADFSAKKPEFIDRDLYVVVYDFTGSVLAHGQNEKMISKNLIDLKDPDGKAFVRERVELAKTQASFWQDYKFVDPVTKKVLPKTMYCERLNDTAVCAGVYKR
ncbi:MAG: histidine kinase [Synechococcaceae cyanobacterium SM1_2_3]|nr:histidine kinase [Synechococcaceae cyanobacterium SM1_2_3]